MAIAGDRTANQAENRIMENFIIKETICPVKLCCSKDNMEEMAYFEVTGTTK